MDEAEKKKIANRKYQAKYRKKNLRDTRLKEILHYEKQKRIVYEHYSNGNVVCACCGEAEYKFLCVDHINDDGAEDRKKNPSHATGRGLYTRLIKDNFPEGYQILCYNCNMAKGIQGVCPHNFK